MKKDIVKDILDRMKKNELFLNWTGEDPAKFLNGRREMNFVKCSNGMVHYKMMIRFRKGKDGDEEIARIMRFAIDNSKTDSTKEQILKNLPPEIASIVTSGRGLDKHAELKA